MIWAVLLVCYFHSHFLFFVQVLNHKMQIIGVALHIMAVSRQIPPRFRTEILLSLFLFLSSCDFSSVHLWLREKRGGEGGRKGGLIMGEGDRDSDNKNTNENNEGTDENNENKEGLLGEEGTDLAIEMFFRSHLVHAHLSTLQKSKSFLFIY